MRHNKTGRRLGRTHEHRKALFKNMASALIEHGRIKTTESKAKELRRVVDKLITLALANDLHARRQAYKVLNNHALVKRLFDEIGPNFVGVKGGFTRVVKLAVPRPGDCAPMAVIELTRKPGEEIPEPAPEKAKAAKAPAAPAAPVAEEAPAEETVEAAAEEAPVEAAAETPAEEAPAEEAVEAAAEEASAEDAPAEEAVEAAAKEAAAEEAPAAEAPAAEASEDEKKDA